jgi:hypothetical protein
MSKAPRNSFNGHFQERWQNCGKRLLASRLSVYLSARLSTLNNSALQEISYLIIFRKYVEEIQVLLKADKNNGNTN